MLGSETDTLDITGKNILKQNNFKSANEVMLDLTNASNGIYFMKISTDVGSITKRIIKK